MIISHKHRFIFLKTNKTAGTSVEIALSKLCGPEDIITPITPSDEVLRKQCGGRAPQNYGTEMPRDNLIKAIKWLVKPMRRKKKFYNHIPAEKVKAYIGDEIWDSYYKFCIERNPWDRVISFYYWRYKMSPEVSISDAIHADVLKPLKKKGWELYSLNGEPAVDRIIRFESLEDDFQSVLKELGIEEKLELPRAKAGYRKDKRHYREILSKEDADQIAEIFRNEIAHLGYEY